MTRQEVIVKLQDLGFVVKLNILNKTVVSLIDNDGQYSVYYWGNFENFKDRISVNGNDLKCSEIYQAFVILNDTLKNIITDKRFKASKSGKWKVAITGVSTILFVPYALDSILIQLKTNSGNKIKELISDNFKNIRTGKVDIEEVNKALAKRAIIGIGGTLLLSALTGTMYYINKRYFEAINTLARYGVIRYSEVTGLGALMRPDKYSNFSYLYNFKGGNGPNKGQFINECKNKFKSNGNKPGAKVNIAGQTYTVTGNNEKEVGDNAARWFDLNIGNNNQSKFGLKFVADGLYNLFHLNRFDKTSTFLALLGIVAILFLLSSFFDLYKVGDNNIWKHRVNGLLELVSDKLFGTLSKGINKGGK